ncbi:polyphosphate:AMP phosphotransferase [Rhodoferax lacus]|uniref:Polyphosphate:AMP phosphotransferase n=1 Tax=Rhodoferax lacus TaxID=2184758 RepID=A0A3E1RH94_9BURK|nr:polyphosphate:AMP phosphotransferase [Rhodoferax lacus]RFO98613.1 polyphosphate:AMP phosphotransferase [Rhodoferax lacus]
MFESAQIGHKVSKLQYKKDAPVLREALLESQISLFTEKKFPVLVLISGEDGAGKRETINVLYEWMDPRYLTTLAFEEPSSEESERPAMWRYWRTLPPKGRIGIFAGSWYSDPIRMRIEGELSLRELDARAAQINRFEAMLVNEGALVLKFWIHLSKEAQRERFETLQNDPHTAWRVTPWSWERLKTYDKLQEVSSHLLRMTNTAAAPWVVVEGVDEYYRSLTVGRVLQAALASKLAGEKPPEATLAPMVRVDTDGRNVLSEMDLGLALGDRDYKSELSRLQGRLSELARDPRFGKRSLVVAFEGADAAGKGGAIRRITAALDARQFQVIPVAAPTEEERAQPHLWRFWRHLPRHNHMAIFDRTWYGRVLVERVEGFCSPAEWQRAYSEINDFEHELVEAGTIVVKFWLQISQEEQLKRFKEREQIAFKRFKITEEDWRNREKWAAYQTAICDMVERTSTGEVPWTLVESNDKQYARVKILRTLCERLEAALAATPKQPSKTKTGKAKTVKDKGTKTVKAAKTTANPDKTGSNNKTERRAIKRAAKAAKAA